MAEVDLVVLFVLDGLRPDGLQQADTPHMDGIFEGGAFTYSARTVMPSATLPCHTSMFRSVTPDRHGITTNTWVPQVRPVPSITDIVHGAGRPTSAFYNWEQLRDLADPGSLDRSYYTSNCRDAVGDLEIAEAAARCLGEQTGFAFVYFGYTDIAGHNSGWMSDPYLQAIANADKGVGQVLSVLDRRRTAIILTSDHGGHERTHGTEMAEDMTIPWATCAPGIPAGYEIDEQIEIIDNPPTIAAYLDLPPPEEWAGKPVQSILPAG